MSEAKRKFLDDTVICAFSYGDFTLFPPNTPKKLIQDCYNATMRKTTLETALAIYPDILHQCHENEEVAAEAAVNVAVKMLDKIKKLEFTIND